MKRYLITIGVLSLGIGMSQIVYAGYNPPAKKSAPSSPTTTTGRRGNCTGNSDQKLTALAPQQHVGQTSSTHPTFSWFVPDTVPKPLQFRLYKVSPTGERLPLHKMDMQSSLGLMKWKFPENLPGLEIGQRYSWQIILFCNPNRPSSSLVTGAEIKIISSTPTLERLLATATNSKERAEVYAEASQWYDALAEVSNSSVEIGLSGFRTQLLEQLADLESNADTTLSNEQSQQLRKIAHFDRADEQ